MDSCLYNYYDQRKFLPLNLVNSYALQCIHRSIPPSQVVLAVSNTYGRVRKPLGFKFIGLISNILALGDVTKLNNDSDCSIWMPIPPPGYSAVGCVAHPGSQPPPNHIVHCLRADLLTSTNFCGCMCFIPPNSGYHVHFPIICFTCMAR